MTDTEFEGGELIVILALVVGVFVAIYYVIQQTEQGVSDAGSAISNAIQAVIAVPGKIVQAVGDTASNFTGVGSWGMGGGLDTSNAPAEDSSPEVPGG
jgi:uncharacterized protein (UPF0333 family)